MKGPSWQRMSLKPAAWNTSGAQTNMETDACPSPDPSQPQTYILGEEWKEARGWADVKLAKKRNYRHRRKTIQKPDPDPARATKRLASRFTR